MDKLDNNGRENPTDLEKGASNVSHNRIGKSLESDAKQQLMLSLLKAKTKNGAITIPKVKRDEKIPLSWSQQQLWFISQLNAQASRAYHISLVVKFEGAINTTLLNDAYKTIIDRHEILRTNIRIDECGDPYQHIKPEHQCKIEEIYLDKSLKGNYQVEPYDKLVAELVSVPFDLEFSAPIRASLISVDDNKYSLLIVLHHIVSDAWSMGCFTRELSTLYNAFLEGQESPLLPLPIQYADYAVWQRNYLQGEKIAKETAYWKDRLSNIPLLNLPTDRPRPRVPSYNGARVDLMLDPTLAQGLKSIGIANGSTMFMTLLGVFKILLNTYTGQADICIGTPLANRPFDELGSLIGYFVNTLALRSYIDRSKSFVDTLKHIKEVTRSALEHQILPFDKVVESVRPERIQSYSPIFQVMMALQNVGGVDARLTSTEVEYENSNCTTSKFDLTLVLEELPDGSVLGAIEYSTDLFDASTIERFKTHLIELSRAILASPAKLLWEIDFLTKQEKHQLLVEWNNTAASYPKDKCIQELFEEQVAKNPDAVAVVFADKELTYKELNSKANQLAHYLIQERSIKPDTLVGICVERSLEMVVGILGILKAGGAYVPLDPDYPQARLQCILEDASLSTVITRRHFQEKAQILDSSAVYIDDADLQSELMKQSANNLGPAEIGLTSTHLAYVIYTSGSTGKPKGVLIEHKAVTSLVKQQSYISIAASNTIAQVSNMSFDAITFELWGSLLNGAKLIYIPKNVLIDSELLSAFLINSNINSIFITTALLKSLVSSKPNLFQNVDNLLFGGEDCSLETISSLCKAGRPKRLVHMYGPTEATTFSLWKELSNNYVFSTMKIALGKSLHFTSSYLLNPKGALVPIGVAGELHIGGAGLARGYLNRADLTDEKFISNPFYESTNPASSERLYKTGDLCRYLPDGNIEFLGRIDHQVKIRGFRIELGEIESALISHEFVKDAVVLARENTTGDKELVAFVVSGGAIIQTADLREYLGKQLPDYMIPSAFAVLEALPLTPNGKIDRKALETVSVELATSGTYVAPRSKLEHQLVEIWSRVLSIDIGSIGIHDNFFELGGHSLLMMALKREIWLLTKINMPISKLYECSNIIALSRILDKTKSENIIGATIKKENNNTTPKHNIYPVSYAQKRTIQSSTSNCSGYEHNIEVSLCIEGNLDPIKLSKSLIAVAKKHDSLRTFFIKSSEEKLFQSVSKKEPKLKFHYDKNEKNKFHEEIKKEIIYFVREPFNIYESFLVRFGLWCDGNNKFYLVSVFHHLIFDGLSIDIFLRDLESEFNNYKEKVSRKNSATYQYWEAVTDQLSWSINSNCEFNKSLGFWKKSLNTYPSRLVIKDLYGNIDKDTDAAYVDASITDCLTIEESDKINKFCAKLKISPFSFYLAAFHLNIFFFGGGDDVISGAPFHGRSIESYDTSIGAFSDTQLLRIKINSDRSIKDYLMQTFDLVNEVHEHEKIPLPLLMAEIQPSKGFNYTPIYNVRVAYQAVAERNPVLEGMVTRKISFDNCRGGSSTRDISLYINPGDNINFFMQYNCSILNEQNALIFLNKFKLFSIFLGDHRNIDYKLNEVIEMLKRRQ